MENNSNKYEFAADSSSYFRAMIDLGSCNYYFSDTVYLSVNDSSSIIQGRVDFDGVENLNFSEFTVFSISDSVSMENNGSFKLMNQFSDQAEMPVLFRKGEDMYFGYYPGSTGQNAITNEDILVFFLSLHYGVILNNYSTDDIRIFCIHTHNSTN
ncbi:MAG: hypothetical protein HC906_14415 [Bacteroidales bacterium]|nr:hypothetical protein [Bacteroidales bacterium]